MGLRARHKGRELGCGAVSGVGHVWRPFRGLWDWFGAREGVVVVVLDVVGVVDGTGRVVPLSRQCPEGVEVTMKRI